MKLIHELLIWEQILLREPGLNSILMITSGGILVVCLIILFMKKYIIFSE